MKKINFELYLITDRKQIKDQQIMPLLKEALDGGVRAIQLREKDWNDRQVYSFGLELRALTQRYRAKLFINDRADLAAAVEADGVHLTQTSYRADQARKILGPDKLIGVSTHSLEQARSAEDEGADFVTLGPIFATPSKMPYGPPVGISLLEEVVEKIKIPIFAIGGIKQENAPSVLQTGSYGIALISGILAAPDVKQTAKEFITLVKCRKSERVNADKMTG